MHFSSSPIQPAVIPANLNPEVIPDTDESRRIRASHATGLLDTAPEKDFDEIVALAAAICEMPISLISLIDIDRQWFKARVGVELTQTPLETSFCVHAIRTADLMMVPDTALDERFALNPLVTGAPGIRFYAGLPLATEDGSRFGTLCVFDRVPRQLTPMQQDALRVLGKQVVMLIQLKIKVAALHKTILENNRMVVELERSDSRFRAFMDALPAAAFIKDEAGTMMFCNHAMTRHFDATPEQWIGKSNAELWPDDLAEKFQAKDREVLEAGHMIRFDDDIVGASLRLSKWDVSMFPFADGDGKRYVAAIALDVTKERLAEQAFRQSQQQLRDLNLKLHKLSLTDGLTRVKNRRGLEDSLQREFERARRSTSPLSLLMLDVDHFKQFNDTYGHIAGDQVLQRIAVLMKQNTRKYDLVARYGGEEFIALLPDTLLQEAQVIANRLCDSISADHWKHRRITVSVGIGTLDANIATPGAFINAVDRALYEAKHHGRNQVRAMAAPPSAEKATA